MLNLLRRVVLPCKRTTSLITVRTYRRAGNNRPRDLAGIRYQRALLDNTEALEDDPEITYDADFSRLNMSHREYEREMKLHQEKIKRYTIKSRYFKSQKQPNFLTWAEKEQIRHLNKEEPDEWTPDRLAQCFPAVEEVIVKVLKAKWAPVNSHRAQKHDENVKKNWELFKDNQFKDLDPQVCEHLKKFSNRNFDSIQNAYAQATNNQIEFQFPQPRNKEFSQIITSCKRIEAKNNSAKDNDRLQIKGKPNLLSAQTEDNLELKIRRSDFTKKMTYEQLIDRAKTKAVEHEEMHLSVDLPKELPSDRSPSTQSEETTQTSNDASEAEHLDESIYKVQSDSKTIDLTLANASSSTKITKYAGKTGSITSAPFPYKIAIPDRLRKRGHTYKLYDCFYDDRGIFLFRVPGLSH